MGKQIVSLLVVGLLVVNVAVAGGCKASKEGLKKGTRRILGVIKGEEKAVRVGTSSMEPAIKAGSLVFYRKEPFEKLKAGDIIVFRDPVRARVLIMRRIVSINGDGSLTVKSEARPEPDPLKVTKEMYVGRIVK